MGYYTSVPHTVFYEIKVTPLGTGVPMPPMGLLQQRSAKGLYPGMVIGPGLFQTVCQIFNRLGSLLSPQNQETGGGGTQAAYRPNQLLHV